MSDSKSIADAIAVLNALLVAAGNLEDYRQRVARAVAEGRDISDTELQQASERLNSEIEAAQQA